MNLIKAVERASAFCGEGAWAALAVVPPTYSPELCVFLPGPDGAEYVLPKTPGYVVAGDGKTFCAVTLDPGTELPQAPMFPDGALFKKALKAFKSHHVHLENAGETVVAVVGPSGGKTLVPATPPSHGKTPEIPRFPLFRLTDEQERALLSVTHAASPKDPDRPELASVAVRWDQCEATDEFRIARAHVSFPLGTRALIPLDVFHGWPKSLGGAYFGLQASTVVLAHDDVVVWSTVREHTWFDLDALIPRKTHDPLVSFSSEALVSAIETATSASDLGEVELAARNGTVEVRGLRADGAVASATTLPAPEIVAPRAVAVRAKSLLASIKACGSSEMYLAIPDHPTRPLRVQHDAYVEMLWPHVHVPPTGAAP